MTRAWVLASLLCGCSLLPPRVVSAQTSQARDGDCGGSAPATRDPESILLFKHGYSDDSGGFVEVWAEIQDDDIRPVDGSVILSVDSIVNVRDGSRHALVDAHVTFVRDTGVCWWTARTPTTEPNDPVVFATSDLPISTSPSDAEVAEFAALETTCVSPFSDEFRARNPSVAEYCDRSRLFATSDLDSDSLTEYWYRVRDPNGFAWAIAEATPEPGGLTVLVKKCGYFVCANRPF